MCSMFVRNNSAFPFAKTSKSVSFNFFARLGQSGFVQNVENIVSGKASELNLSSVHLGRLIDLNRFEGSKAESCLW